MIEQSGLTKILLFLQVEPVWVIVLVAVSLFFVISLIRKLLKLAFVLMLVMVGVYYYVQGEATAFWVGQSDTLQEAVAEVPSRPKSGGQDRRVEVQGGPGSLRGPR